jgi:uncharacterized protein
MKFLLNCTKPVYNDTGIERIDQVSYVYDNMTSEIFDSKNKLVNIKPVWSQKSGEVVDPISVNTPGSKSDIKLLKIQMGLSCNYSCEYCSQRFVPNIDHSNTKLMDRFIDNMDNWLEIPPEKIEFWGGEPFVYWKIMKPLAERLRKKYPKTRFSVITNGSLITEEIIDWLYYMGFSMAVSHDGPGQNVRGPDPFEDPVQRKILFKLFNRFLPEGRISINSMVHRENMDRANIQKFFEDLFNLNPQDNFTIGEGGFIDVYDEGGKKNVPQGDEEHVGHRMTTLLAIRNNDIGRFAIVKQRVQEWLNSWGNYRSADTLGQKCGMDEKGALAVDLQGNVLTCQNVTAVSKAPNGKSHRIGHVNQLANVKLNTSTHWKFRDDCSKCPLLQVCKGSCMFLEGEYFKLSCDAAYSDHLPFFAIALEAATGALPYKITAIDDEYQLPEDRQDLWGQVRGVKLAVPQVREQAIPTIEKK